MRRAIISTSTSCLDYFEIPENLFILHNHINVLGNRYLDCKTISVDRLAEMMDSNKQALPTTSPPEEDEIADLFYELMNQGYEEILVICISARMSETFERVQNIKGLFANRLNIHVFDTHQSSYMEGLMALEAVRMTEEGRELYDIERRLKYMRDEIKVWFMLDDLTNLIKTKRIFAPAGYLANMFSIKPLLGYDDVGNIIPIERVRKTDRAIERMCELTLEKAKGQRHAQIYLLSVGDVELDRQLRTILHRQGYTNLPVIPVATSSLANLGTRGTGIGVFVDNWQGRKPLQALGEMDDPSMTAQQSIQGFSLNEAGTNLI